MAVNGLNVGKDVTLDVVTQLGTAAFSVRTNFQSRQVVAGRSSHGADGVVRHLNIPAGWEGSFNFDRADASLDNYFAAVEALYYVGGAVLSATLTETISEQDGSVSTFMYTGVVLELSDAGDKKGDDLIKMRVDFKASQRVKLS